MIAIHLFQPPLLPVAAVAPTCSKGLPHAWTMCSVGCASLKKGIVNNDALVYYVIYLYLFHNFLWCLIIWYTTNYATLFISLKKHNWHVNIPSTTLLVRTVRQNTAWPVLDPEDSMVHIVHQVSKLWCVSSSSLMVECLGNVLCWQERVADGCSCGLPVVLCMLWTSHTTAHASKPPVSSERYTL